MSYAIIKHPDNSVQNAIDALVKETDIFDARTKGKSIVLVVSSHGDEVFHSVTGNLEKLDRAKISEIVVELLR
ncbi:MAG: hypothetical protein ACREAG_07605 [Nitrosopumilaceae archaeon]